MPKRRRSIYPSSVASQKGGIPRKLAKTAASVIQQAALNALPPQARFAITAAQKVGDYLKPISRSWKHNYKGVSRRNYGTQTKSKGMAAYSGKGFQGVSTGKYSGRFRKFSRRFGKAGEGKLEYHYGKRGYVIRRETHGSVSDPHCVYLGASTYERDQLARAILGAMYRKLFAKAGIRVPAANEIPALQDPVSGVFNDGPPFAGGYKILGRYRRNNNTVGEWIYTIPDNARFEDIVVSNPIYNDVRTMMNDSGSPDWYAVETIGLYMNIGGTFPDRLVAELNMKEEYVEVATKVTLTVQNRTKAAGTGTNNDETDRVDNQPLKGWNYFFRSAVPEHKSYGVPQLVGMSEIDGICLVRSEQLVLQYREPPHPKFWTNCTKQSYVKIQPGDIKKQTIYYKYSGMFNDLVTQKLNARFGVQPGPIALPSVARRAYGRCMMFALEELLNSGSSNPITVAYESERFTGALLKTRKTHVMLSEYEESVQNNVP